MCLREILRTRGWPVSARVVCSGTALQLPDRTSLLECQHAMSIRMLSIQLINRERDAVLTGANDDTV
jgi:hypothetical protein